MQQSTCVRSVKQPVLRTLVSLASAWLATCPSDAHAAGECLKYGSPTYAAERTLVIGSGTVRSKVYVKAGSEREEVTHGDKLEIIITTPKEFMRFMPQTKAGIRHPLIAPNATKPDPNKMRMREEASGDNKRMIIEVSDDGKTFSPVSDVECRPDGTLLSKKFKIPVGGNKLVDATMTQTILPDAKIDDGLFVPPKDIKFK